MSTIIDTPLFDKVHEAIGDAVLVAWDGCHKMYVALDEVEAQWFRESYPHVVEGDADVLLATLEKWWDASCGLRFINGVSRNPETGDSDFTALIEQFEDEEYDEDEED